MKLPVFKAVGMTFAVTAAHWLDLVKIVWLPVVLLFALFALIMPSYMQSMAGMGATGVTSDPSEAMAMLGATLPMALLIMLLSLAFYLVIFTGVLKLVLHGEKPKLPFYIGFGADELRLLGTWVLQILMLIGAIIVAGFIAGIGFAMGAAGAIFSLVATLVCYVALIWICLRLSLATPAAIGMRTIGIGPSWNTAKGNVWSLLGYWLIWGVILLIIEVVIVAVMMPGYFETMGQAFAPAGSPEEMQARVEAMNQQLNEQMAGMYDLTSPANIARLAGGTLLGVVIMVIMAVSGGVAWRLMTDDQPEKHFD